MQFPSWKTDNFPDPSNTLRQLRYLWKHLFVHPSHRIYFVYQSHLAVCISSILQMPMQCIHFIVALDICKGKSHKCHRRRHLFRLLRRTLLQYCSRWCSLYNLDVQLNCSHISYKNTCRVTGTTQNIVSWSSQIDTCCMAYLSKILTT